VLFMAAAHWEQVDVQQSRRAYQHYLSQYSDTDLALTILAHHRLSVLVDEPHQAARHQEALLAAFAQHPGAAGPRSSHLAGMAALSGLEESARAARDLESLAQLVDTEQVWGDARQRVETDNNDIEAYLMLGRLYLERRDPLRARALAQTAQSTLAGAADDPRLIAIIAWSRWLEDDTGAAIAGLERASRMDPADAWVASRLTAVRMTQHDWEGALATATRPLDRGICLHRLGLLDEAEAAYQQATQASPQAPQPVHNLAVLYTQQNRASDAATSIRTFRQLGGNPVAAQALEEALP
jgi:Flp pilus assembly protein TadD